MVLTPRFARFLCLEAVRTCLVTYWRMHRVWRPIIAMIAKKARQNLPNPSERPPILRKCPRAGLSTARNRYNTPPVTFAKNVRWGLSKRFPSGFQQRSLTTFPKSSPRRTKYLKCPRTPPRMAQYRQNALTGTFKKSVRWGHSRT